MTEKLTHWRVVDNPKYLGAYSFQPNEEKILTIKRMAIEQVYNPNSGKIEDRRVAYFEENEKPMIINVTNARTIIKFAKTDYMERWSGTKIQVYVGKAKTKGGGPVPGLLIRETPPKQTIPNQSAKEFICSECGSKVTAFNGRPAEYIAQYSQQKYGKVLCGDCGAKVAKAQEGQVNE